MPLEKPSGVRYGDAIVAHGERPSIGVGDDLLGRVIDGAGLALDGRGLCNTRTRCRLDGAAPLALERLPIREPLGCGIRAIDAFLTCGRGQRLGIFGGSGVGKSTLIGMMARGTSADLTVLALVGERGREVGEFLEGLGDAGRQRSVVVVSTSDQSPLLRIRAALAATAIAEYFCQTGKDVLLVVDSLTRFAMAQREIGLAAGEPPTAKAYTPSVFSMLARLVERAGRFAAGSITAFYTVLMEGDDQQDPLVDALRSLVDGHIVLDRRLASQNQYPPIAVLDSLSRLMPAVVSREHLTRNYQLRALLSAYVRLGRPHPHRRIQQRRRSGAGPRYRRASGFAGFSAPDTRRARAFCRYHRSPKYSHRRGVIWRFSSRSKPCGASARVWKTGSGCAWKACWHAGQGCCTNSNYPGKPACNCNSICNVV